MSVSIGQALIDLMVGDKDYVFAHALGKTCEASERDNLSKLMVNIFLSHGVKRLLDFVNYEVTQEINGTSQRQLIFRTNSITNKFVGKFLRFIGPHYLRHSMTALTDVIQNYSSFEINPSMLKEGDDLEENKQRLLAAAQQIVDEFLKSVFQMPSEMRQVLLHIQSTSTAKFEDAGYDAVGGIIFLRYMCPAIISPEQYGVIDDASLLSPAIRRGLILTTKLVQNLANNAEFGQKEEYMVPLNGFIRDNQPKIMKFFEEITAPMPETDSIQETKIDLPVITDDDVLDLHHYLFISLPKVAEELTKGIIKDGQVSVIRELCSSLYAMGPAPPSRREREKGVEEKKSKLHARFKLPESIKLIFESKCVLDKKPCKLHGTVYMTHTILYFFSKVFGMTTKESIELNTITNVVMEKKDAENKSVLRVSVESKVFSFLGFASAKEIHTAKQYLDYYKLLNKHKSPDVDFRPHHRQRTNTKWQDGTDLVEGLRAATHLMGSFLPSPRGQVPDPQNKLGETQVEIVSAEITEQILLDSIMTERDWNLLLEGAELRAFKCNEVVLQEGKFSQVLFQIARGKVRVEKLISGSTQPAFIATMSEGEVFGEMSFLDGDRASASIVADGDDVEIYAMAGPFVESLLQTEPGLPGRMYRYMATMLAIRMRKRSANMARQAAERTPTPPQRSDNEGKVFTRTEINRHNKIKKIFSIPSDENILHEWQCSVERNFPVCGRLYATEKALFFFGKLIGYKIAETFPLSSVQFIGSANGSSKKDGLTIASDDSTFVFWDFPNRDEVIPVLEELVDVAKAQKGVSSWVVPETVSDDGRSPTPFEDVDRADGMMTEKDWVMFLEGAKPHLYKKNDVILAQDMPVDAVHQIGRGSVRVENTIAGEVTVVAKVGEGELFGEITFLAGGNATASVITSEDTLVYSVDKKWIESLLSIQPDLPGRFYKYLAVRLVQRIRGTAPPPSKQEKPPAVKSMPPLPLPPQTDEDDHPPNEPLPSLVDPDEPDNIEEPLPVNLILRPDM